MFLASLHHLASLQLLARGGGAGPRFLFPLLLILALGGLGAWLIRRRRGPDHSGSAMEALRERFARGDIDRAEFEHRQAVLVGADVIPPPSTSSAAPPADVEAPEPPADGGGQQ